MLCPSAIQQLRVKREATNASQKTLSGFCNSSGLHSKAPCQACCKINTQQPLLTNTLALPSGMRATACQTSVRLIFMC